MTTTLPDDYDDDAAEAEVEDEDGPVDPYNAVANYYAARRP